MKNTTLPSNNSNSAQPFRTTQTHEKKLLIILGIAALICFMVVLHSNAQPSTSGMGVENSHPKPDGPASAVSIEAKPTPAAAPLATSAVNKDSTIVVTTPASPVAQSKREARETEEETPHVSRLLQDATGSIRKGLEVSW